MKGGNTVAQIFNPASTQCTAQAGQMKAGGCGFVIVVGRGYRKTVKDDPTSERMPDLSRVKLNSILSKSQIKGTVRCVALKHIVEESSGNT
jgi:hypothetical protein